MDKDEMKMIEEMAIIISGSTELDTMNYYKALYKAKALYKVGCRIITEDEIVIKKRQYEQLKKYNRDRKRLRLRWQQAKQEKVKKILQELSDEGYKIYEQQGYTFDIGNFYWLIAYAKRKYGINLE